MLRVISALDKIDNIDFRERREAQSEDQGRPEPEREIRIPIFPPCTPEGDVDVQCDLRAPTTAVSTRSVYCWEDLLSFPGWRLGKDLAHQRSSSPDHQGEGGIPVGTALK